MEKKHEETHKEVFIDSSFSAKASSKSEIKAEEVSKESEKEETIEYDGCKGDSLKVIKKGPDGKLISETIITGKGKGKFHSKDKSVDKKLSENKAIKQESESKGSLKKIEKDEKILEAKTVTVTQGGFTFWTWFWLILIIIIVIVLIYLNYRFKLVKRVTTFFSK